MQSLTHCLHISENRLNYSWIHRYLTGEGIEMPSLKNSRKIASLALRIEIYDMPETQDSITPCYAKK